MTEMKSATEDELEPEHEEGDEPTTPVELLYGGVQPRGRYGLSEKEAPRLAIMP